MTCYLGRRFPKFDPTAYIKERDRKRQESAERRWVVRCLHIFLSGLNTFIHILYRRMHQRCMPTGSTPINSHPPPVESLVNYGDFPHQRGDEDYASDRSESTGRHFPAPVVKQRQRRRSEQSRRLLLSAGVLSDDDYSEDMDRYRRRKWDEADQVAQLDFSDSDMFGSGSVLTPKGEWTRPFTRNPRQRSNNSREHSREYRHELENRTVGKARSV